MSMFASSEVASAKFAWPTKWVLPGALGGTIAQTRDTTLADVSVVLHDGAGLVVVAFTLDALPAGVSYWNLGTGIGFAVFFDPSIFVGHNAGEWVATCNITGVEYVPQIVPFQWGGALADAIAALPGKIGTPSTTLAGDVQNAINAGNLAATKAQNAVDVLGTPPGGHTIAGDVTALRASLADAIATLALHGAKLDDLAAVLGAEKGMRLGYDAAAGLLTIAQASSSVWQMRITSGSPTRVRIKVSGTQFDSDDYGGDFPAMLAAIAAHAGVLSCVGVSGGFDVTAVPGVNVITVTDLLITGGTGTLTQTATGAWSDLVWIQFYADAACTTPHAGPMATALGKIRLSAAP